MLDSLLDQLARQRGIGDVYHNYRGDLVTISRTTKTAILAAMGCPTDDSAAAERLLRDRDSERWRVLLPPVAVVDPARMNVAITVPADSLEQPVHWRVVAHDGTELAGAVRAGNLHEYERGEVDGRWVTRRALGLPIGLPHGYHQLSVALGSDAAVPSALISAPARCYEPPVLHEGGRLWGLAVQLYTLRSGRNWGIGDFADLAAVVRACVPHGAAFIGLNPLHALFPANPLHFSPYSASSRHFLNVLYVAVELLPEFAECAPVRQAVSSTSFQAELERLRATSNVDYAGVARAKLPVLRKLFAYFQREHAAKDTARSRLFAAYRAARGESLRLHALHDAIDEHYRELDHHRFWGWPVWPEGLHDPNGSGVRDFAGAHADAVDFHAWLQWLADEQLRAVKELTIASGMPVGLYGDYAVGVNRYGSETWSEQALYCMGAGVGAPPDALALKGQDWGIPPQDPHVLQAERYLPFSRLIAANMRHYGALRLDHVMALFRQWWVPVGLGATEGGYVHYPVDDLMSVLALESERHACLVIGEDLGTVPPEMMQVMRERSVYSYRVLLFEKHADGRFLQPGEYPRRAIATVTTHDLPTLKGFWSGEDIALRRSLGLYPNDEICRQVADERQRDQRALLEALVVSDLRPAGLDGPANAFSSLADAIHVYLARSASALVILQAEDLASMTDPVNVPGTNDEHANWQRKMVSDLGGLLAEKRVRRLLDEIQTARCS